MTGIPTGGGKDGSQMFLDYLAIEGVDTVFGIPGGGLIPFLVSLKNRGKEFRFVLARQESGALFAADGYSRVRGKLGVGMVTSGPGALNALNGMVNANDSHSPVLLVTGELELDLVGKGYIQEGLGADLDIPMIYKGATQYSALCSDIQNFQTQLEHALRVSRTYPSYGTHLTVPNGVSGEPQPDGFVIPTSSSAYRPTQHMAAPRAEAQTILDNLLGADKPLIFLGNGCRRPLLGAESGDQGRLQKLIDVCERFALPVMTTPDGKGIFPETHPLSLRHFGKASCPWPAHYMTDPPHDALLTLGASLHDLDTERWNPALKPKGPFMQVDLDTNVIGRGYPIELGVVSEVGAMVDVLHELAAEVEIDKALNDRIDARRALLATLHGTSPFTYGEKMSSNAEPAFPQAIMAALNDLTPEDAHVLIDAGNVIAWGCHYLTVDPLSCESDGDSVIRGQIHNALGMGPMGWATAAVVGTKVAAPDATCISVTGDGAFMMQGSEVSTAAAHGIGAIWVVLDNDDLGMVSQGMYVLSGKDSHDWDPTWEGYYRFGNPDLAGWARSLGADAYHVRTPADFRTAFATALEQSRAGAPTSDEGGTKFHLGGTPQVIVVDIDQAEIPPLYPPSMMPPGVE
ncbi:MAG: thiamine pyrophosphate-binding protein [Gemmatimonadota bacterium]